MTDPNNLEGTRTPEELAASLRELNRIAPTSAEKFRLMFGQSNETMTTPYWTPPTRPHDWPTREIERQCDRCNSLFFGPINKPTCMVCAEKMPANLPPLPPEPPKMSDFDVWHMPCARCGFDPGKGESNTCWKCGNLLYRDFSDRALKRPIEAVRDEPARYEVTPEDRASTTALVSSLFDEPAKDEPTSGEEDATQCVRCQKREAQPMHFLCKECYSQHDGEPRSGTEARACEDALAPFRNVARGIPDNWPGDCILRFDQREDGTIFLAYHGVNDASGGITIEQWRALLPQTPEGGKP